MFLGDSQFAGLVAALVFLSRVAVLFWLCFALWRFTVLCVGSCFGVFDASQF